MPFQEIVIEELAEIGFESFVENEDGLLAYIQKPLFNENAVKGIDSFSNPACKLSYAIKEIPDQNWNAVWESAYDPILVEDCCFIHAPFHQPNPDVKYNILIEPKMSFGTGHHATTYTMLSYLNEEDLTGKDVLDMGCGTAVLAIFSVMKGAAKAEAIDNDEWAYANSIENVVRNKKEEFIRVRLGDASLLKDKEFDVIIANINRNILLNDMHIYAQSLRKNGVLLMSGFYEPDMDVIRKEAEKHGLIFSSYKEKNHWAGTRFIKKSND